MNEYFTLISEYIGIVTWFLILIAAKIGSLGKKLTTEDKINNILYCIVGGVMAYFGTFAFKWQLRVIAVGIGCMAGDVLIKWLPANMKENLELLGRLIKALIKKKFK